MQVWADENAPLTEDAEVKLRALATALSEPERTFRITVLPAQGDIRLRVVSGGWTSGEPLALFQIEGHAVHQTTGGGPGRGFHFVAIDAETGILGPLRSFDTWTSDDDVRALEDYLESLPYGVVVLAAVADDGFLRLRAETFAAIREHLSSELIDQLEYQDSWAIVARKGALQPMAEKLGRFEQADVELVLSFPLQ